LKIALKVMLHFNAELNFTGFILSLA